MPEGNPRLIRRVSTGHLYTEDFDNLDSWDITNIVTAEIISGEFRFAGDSGGQSKIHMYLTEISPREDVFAYCEFKTPSNTWANFGLWVRFQLDTFSHTGICNWNRDYGSKEYLRERLEGAQVGLLYNGSFNWGLSTWYKFAIAVEGTQAWYYRDNTCIVSGATITTVTNEGYVALHHYMTNHTDPSYVRKLVVMTEKNIYMNNLPSGWKATVGSVTAIESGGTATLDCGILDFPANSIVVKNASDTVMDTWAGNVYGGDVFEYTFEPTGMFIN